MRCDVHQPIWFKLLLSITYFCGIPLYFCAFYFLINRTSKEFSSFRNLLIMMIIGNLANDTYISFLWLPRFYLPWMAMCSTGLAKNFPFGMLFLNMINLVYSANLIIEMFDQRMKAVLMGGESKMTRFVTIDKYMVLIGSCSVLIVQCLCRTYMTSRELKERINATRGPMPCEAFSDQCIFIIDWTNVYCVLLVALTMVFSTNAFALMVVCATTAYKKLKRSKVLSERTRLMQKKLLNILVIQVTIHTILLLTPMESFYLAHFIDLVHPFWKDYVVYFNTTLLGMHGSMCTLTILITVLPCSKKNTAQVVSLATTQLTTKIGN
ncbi:unnamed protein product [Caenorhabditis bovis]|uniref:Uncharacterized protein n=1 Tax=Caenorhabditis bovis TaxID=2654633 RepID=A0A8S1EMY3_9PELO|nr:unnamed protein product [Caenorhabditis bovis]